MKTLLHQLIIDNQEYILNELKLPEYVRKTVTSIINCRTMELGGHVYVCPDLHGGLFHYNSCKKRGCPVCMEYEQYNWFENQKHTLPPTFHNHLIFKIPSELSLLWLYNKKQVHQSVFSSVLPQVLDIYVLSSTGLPRRPSCFPPQVVFW